VAFQPPGPRAHGSFLGVQIEMPRRLARFNKVATNRVQGVYAWVLPPWAVIAHRGRRTGHTYRTPVMATRRDGVLAVAVMYGERSDWVQNVLAGGGQVVRGGRTYDLIEPRLVSAGDADLPRAARGPARLTEKVLVAKLGPAAAGFGPGPRA
jgi:deazaflavin-dependent oxidoreductase (nitroreductase family)